MLTHTALDVDADGAVAWAAAHPGWFIFPGQLVWDHEGEKWAKKPLVRWTERATADPVEIRELWDSIAPTTTTSSWGVVAGRGVICVACAPSGIWVLDQDGELDPDTDEAWISLLDSIVRTSATLVLRSCTRGLPHYVFRQGSDWVAEGRWAGGEVKSSGMIVISSAEPFVDAPVRPAPSALVDRMRVGRPRGSRGRGVATAEELAEWLASTPDLDDLVLDATAADHFIDVVVEHMIDEVEGGAHRRQACLNAVFQAAIEAAAGCYPAETAYVAIRDAYRILREGRGEGGDKGWSRDRARDYETMWASLVPAMVAGDYDDKVIETRMAAEERYGGDPDDMRTVIEAIIAGATEPVKVIPAAELAPPAGVDPTTGEMLDWGAVGVAAEAPFPDFEPGREPPVLDEDALWGPHGDLIEALRGRHESSDVGVLGALVAYAGAHLAGRASWRLGVDVHGPNDYVLNIGASSAARKSSALSLVERGVFFDPDRMAESPLSAAFMPRRISGVASGERLIHVWVATKNEDGTEEWPERRVVLIESEASAMWKRAKRDGAVLSDVVCKMWDQADLANHAITSGSASVPADRHLASFIGASTTHVAQAMMRSADGTDAKSGFANRFLWLYLPDSGVDLPFGAELPLGAVRKYQEQLGLYSGGAVAEGFGAVAGFDPAAAELWGREYGRVKRDKGAAGFVEAMCSRGESHVLRLALNYWLAAGGAPESVGVPALRAGLALWRYAKESVEYIFGDATGDRDTDNLVAELEARGGWATFEELRADLNKNSLAGLASRGVESGVLVSGRVRTGKSGRPPKALGLARWLAEGRAVPMSAGTARIRPTPLASVEW